MKQLSRLAVLCVALLACVNADASGKSKCAADTSANRQAIEKFVDLFYRQKKVREAFETYVVPDYVQHNPAATDGRDAAIKLLEPMLAAYPELKVDVLRIVVDGEIAVVHSRALLSPTQPAVSTFDMFRMKNGKIVEHWDVMQSVPEKSVSSHPLF